METSKKVRRLIEKAMKAVLDLEDESKKEVLLTKLLEVRGLIDGGK